MKDCGLAITSLSLIIRSSLQSHWKRRKTMTLEMLTRLRMSVRFFASRTVLLRQRKLMRLTSALRIMLIYNYSYPILDSQLVILPQYAVNTAKVPVFTDSGSSADLFDRRLFALNIIKSRRLVLTAASFYNSINIIYMQRQTPQQRPSATTDPLRENQRMSRELASIKLQLYGLYEENLQLREIAKEGQRDRQLVRECEAELARLKNLLREVTDKRDSMPSEREEIKDRIIMKLEDELICTKIELKEANLQIHKLTRMQ